MTGPQFGPRWSTPTVTAFARSGLLSPLRKWPFPNGPPQHDGRRNRRRQQVLIQDSGRFFLGQSGDPPVEPCAIRIRAGDTDFDPEYFLDVGELAGTELAWGPLQGSSGRGYFVIYDPEVVPIPDNLDGLTDQDLTNTPAWVLYSAVLGNEEATLTKVSGLDPSGGIVLNSV